MIITEKSFTNDSYRLTSPTNRFIFALFLSTERVSNGCKFDSYGWGEWKHEKDWE